MPDDPDPTLPSPPPDRGSKNGSGPTSSKWQPPTPEELQAQLPQYEITALLGRGGMGAVYKGTQINLDRPVAIKILPPSLEEDDSGANFTERFKNEARAMARLSHPGIVAVYDSGETADGLLYIVMEFIEGTDVQKMVTAQRRLHSEHTMAITAHVCDALQYAHERGIIHRDIKPANIMVGYDGVVKVADFGLAKMDRAGESGLTRSGMAMGTLHYMAPEALMLGSSVDHRADIYAVGVMLYYMLTGKLPQGMFELPSLQIPGLDPRFDGIIAKALRDDRDIRHQSAVELRHDLDGILTQPIVQVAADALQTPAALPTEARPQRPAGHSTRQPAARVEKRGSPLLWVIVLLLSGLSLWLWLTQQSGSQTPPGERPDGAITEMPANPAAPAGWRSLLTDKPEIIGRLKITDATTPGWKLMQSGFAPLLDAKNIALRMKARSHSLRLVARWSEAPDNGTHGYTLRIGPGTDGNTRMFSGWIKTTGTNSTGVTEPRTYNSTGPSALGASPLFEFAEGQEYEVELRSLEHRIEVLVDGKVMVDVRNISLPGNVVALHPFKAMEFKDLEWRQLPPHTVADSHTPPPKAAATSNASISDLTPGVWHDLFEKKLITTAALARETDGSYRATAIVMSTSTPVFRNCVIRAKFGAGQWNGAPKLIVRREEEDKFRYVSATSSDYKAFLRNHTQRGYDVFGTTGLNSPLLREQAFDLELEAIGDRFTFRKDGKILVTQSLSGYDTGHVGFLFEIGTVIKKLEVMPLDGLSDEQIKTALLATTAATPPPPAPAPMPADTQNMKLVVDADFTQQQAAFRDSESSKLKTRWEDQTWRLM